jgi:polyhydroxybutyrate depolymerase
MLVVPTTTVAGAPGAGPSPEPEPDPVCFSVPIGTQSVTVSGGGVDHAVRIQIPRTFKGARTPAVIDFHGLGSTGEEQAVLSGYAELGEQEGFIVVHPTGVPNAGDDRAAWQLASSPPDDTHDDVEFASVLIDELIGSWCADDSRIYVTGMSNGGFFASRLTCLLADRIAAAVAVGGISRPDDCAPARVVPISAFHGTADTFVPFDGNGESELFGSGDLPAELFTSDIAGEVAEFAAAAGCAVEPVDTPFGDTVVRHAYEGCDDGSAVALVELLGGGHVWPRPPDWPLDATADGWSFMSQFSL